MAAIGEDSSGQEMKKKHAVGKDRRRGGHEVPRGFEPRSNNRKSAVRARVGPLWLCASLFTCPCCDEQDLHCRGYQKCSGAAG